MKLNYLPGYTVKPKYSSMCKQLHFICNRIKNWTKSYNSNLLLWLLQWKNWSICEQLLAQVMIYYNNGCWIILFFWIIQVIRLGNNSLCVYLFIPFHWTTEWFFQCYSFNVSSLCGGCVIFSYSLVVHSLCFVLSLPALPPPRIKEIIRYRNSSGESKFLNWPG